MADSIIKWNVTQHHDANITGFDRIASTLGDAKARSKYLVIEAQHYLGMSAIDLATIAFVRSGTDLWEIKDPRGAVLASVWIAI